MNLKRNLAWFMTLSLATLSLPAVASAATTCGNHPEVAGDYAKLKRELAAAFDNDFSGYMNAKTAFVAATLAEALGPGEQVLLDRPLPAETSRS